MSRAAIIIPARYASARLKPLIQHTYERAAAAKAASVVLVATDDQRIFDAVTAFGGKAVMTAQAHETGTARIAEAAARLEAEKLDAEIIVNLQGDEPEIDPAHLDLLISVHERSGAFASTLACRFPAAAGAGAGSPDDPSAVKVILDEETAPGGFRFAKFFTRSISAWPRAAGGAITNPAAYFLHLGVYAFSRTSLQHFAASPPGALERSLRLEQLRILEMGEKIAVAIVDEAMPGVDTPEDYARFVRRQNG